MKTLKMSLENIQGKLSRSEMKKVMAGSGEPNSICFMRCSQDSNSFPVSTCSSSTYRALCPDGNYGSCAC